MLAKVKICLRIFNIKVHISPMCMCLHIPVLKRSNSTKWGSSSSTMLLFYNHPMIYVVWYFPMIPVQIKYILMILSFYPISIFLPRNCMSVPIEFGAKLCHRNLWWLSAYQPVNIYIYIYIYIYIDCISIFQIDLIVFHSYFHFIFPYLPGSSITWTRLPVTIFKEMYATRLHA